jgi:cystathionine beta-lyase
MSNEDATKKQAEDHTKQEERFPTVVPDYNNLPTYPPRPDFAKFENSLRPASQMIVFDGAPNDPNKPSSTPIYQTSTFVQPNVSEFGTYDYTRSGNPTRTALEKQVALLEGAKASFAFTSGMSALSALTRILMPGDELIVGNDIYGGMHRLVTKVTHPSTGLKVAFADTTDLEAVEAAITPNTRLLHMETPSNPLMKITDIRKLAALLSSRGILLSIDATMMSPYLMKPLKLGADIVLHSATKFFGGHADTMGGFVSVKDETLARQIAFYQNAEGTALAPFDCWLFLRGIKTMAIRIDRSQENALSIARFLESCPQVTKVFFCGLPSFEGYAIHKSQAAGAGTVMTFTTGDTRLSQRFCDACRIFKLTVSFGSVNSLCEMPCIMSHASIPAEERTLPEDLIRLSVGIEDIRDLIDDLTQAFELAAGNIADIVKYREAQRLLFDSQFEDVPLTPQLPTSVTSKL